MYTIKITSDHPPLTVEFGPVGENNLEELMAMVKTWFAQHANYATQQANRQRQPLDEEYFTLINVIAAGAGTHPG